MFARGKLLYCASHDIQTVLIGVHVDVSAVINEAVFCDADVRARDQSAVVDVCSLFLRLFHIVIQRKLGDVQQGADFLPGLLNLEYAAFVQELNERDLGLAVHLVRRHADFVDAFRDQAFHHVLYGNASRILGLLLNRGFKVFIFCHTLECVLQCDQAGDVLVDAHSAAQGAVIVAVVDRRRADCSAVICNGNRARVFLKAVVFRQIAQK